jgi:acyl carrier protein
MPASPPIGQALPSDGEDPGGGPSAERVLALVRRRLPPFWRDRPISLEMRLDDSGIGLDSVDLLELLVACEEELGRKLPPDLLLDDEMTVGDLVARLEAATATS